MSNIEDRLTELKTASINMIGRITYIEEVLAAIAKRLDELDKDQNYALRAFIRMHPERFAGLDPSNDGGLAYAAFLRTHPEIFTDLDRVDAILGGDQSSEKPQT
jgi:hypothetical protein